MKKILNYESNEQAKYFGMLRKKYPVRREFSNYDIQISENEVHLNSILENFRFTIRIF